MFRRNRQPSTSCSKESRERNQLKAGRKQIFIDPENGNGIFYRNMLVFTCLHGAISKEMIVFITTAVRTSNFKG
jgi:hypothetical protein